MSEQLATALTALNRRYLLDYPELAAARVEEMPPTEAAEALAEQEAAALIPVFTHLAPDVSATLLGAMPRERTLALLTELPPNDAARFLSALDTKQRDEYLGSIDEALRKEIERMLEFPAESAGRLMQTRVAYFRDSATVGTTLDRLREARARSSRSLFVIDESGRLSGRVGIQELAVAPLESTLKDLAQPVSATVSPIAPRDEVVDLLERFRLVDLPVVDVNGRLLGIIYHDALIQAMQEDASVDIQTMVGASRDERALSPSLFAVRRRLPWLQINLLTAFMAAFVVGLFENTIAMFTALAVLLPVVAGQSGNAGAQALAVTMRGLALREIGLSHWWQVTAKEVRTGFINGLAVAVTCGIGVYLWSGSLGLVLVIAVSMVLAMVAAGFAGAVVPIVLVRLGQDPAQSSSIILTTVTDIAGFFSFLGIATMLSNML